ncbi:putative pre-rRNA-processing protein Ipi1 [Helianthus anomalus]
MSDDDKIVRETLYQLLKAVVFPAYKEDNQGTFISLMIAYVFNAMTHLSIDVRLMAFKFFDMVVQHYPLSFSMYADKVFVLFILTWEIARFLLYLKNIVFMHSFYSTSQRDIAEKPV